MSGVRRSRVQAPVVIHRWFARGEGWAVHPDLTSAHLHRIILTLASLLTRRPRGPFRFDLDEGILLGELVDDPECPDLLARGRGPFILRAVLLPAPWVPEHPEAVQESLRHLPLPARPGDDGDLVVAVPCWSAESEQPGESPPVPESLPAPGLPGWLPLAGAVLAGLLAVGGLLLALEHAGQGPPSAPEAQPAGDSEPGGRSPGEGKLLP